MEYLNNIQKNRILDINKGLLIFDKDLRKFKKQINKNQKRNRKTIY